MTATIERVDFVGSTGAKLSARLDRPAAGARGYAIFAHCFTCSKDLNAVRCIAGELARLGIAVLRFDFTGLGSSEGEFASTNFSSNVGDLKSAADYLRTHFGAPELLIGHSLGGAAVLAAAADIPEVKAVATIGAPADAAHVIETFKAHEDKIRSDGVAEVSLAGRKFSIQRQFLDDLLQADVRARVAGLRKALLVLHSPTDETVGIENASEIFGAAKHPKSFVSLDGADHLLTNERDANFAARTIAAWADRYLTPPAEEDTVAAQAYLRETHNGTFQNSVRVGPHMMLADEPKSYGGLGSGPSPYDYLAVALGACTAMTLRLYADRKKWDVGTISVAVDHGKVHALDEGDDARKAVMSKIDEFKIRLSFSGEIDAETEQRLLEIANKCPVHRTLESPVTFDMSVADI